MHTKVVADVLREERREVSLGNHVNLIIMLFQTLQTQYPQFISQCLIMKPV